MLRHETWFVTSFPANARRQSKPSQPNIYKPDALCLLPPRIVRGFGHRDIIPLGRQLELAAVLKHLHAIVKAYSSYPVPWASKGWVLCEERFRPVMRQTYLRLDPLLASVSPTTRQRRRCPVCCSTTHSYSRTSIIGLFPPKNHNHTPRLPGPAFKFRPPQK